MDKHLYWAWALKNIVCVICWTALAIIFNKWWIALFGIFFMHDIKNAGSGTRRLCDGCGKHGPSAKNSSEAIDKAKKEGWVHIASNDTDYCPDCFRKILNDYPKE